MNKKEMALRFLDACEVEYTLVDHPAVFNMEDIGALRLFSPGVIAKNLFLRDEKGRRHFLIVLRGDKTADLRALQAQLGTARLSFASEARLLSLTGLTKGEVTPLGVLHDAARSVEVVLDEDLFAQELVGVHPCDNTATVLLAPRALRALIAAHGSPCSVVKIGAQCPARDTEE